MKAVSTITGLREELRKVKDGVAGDTIFGAKALLFIAERLDSLDRKNGTRKPRKASKWNQFFAEGMKAGKSPTQIANEWRLR